MKPYKKALTDSNSHMVFNSINMQLPLQAFFNELRLNNFLVTPSQIADCSQLINKYSSTVANEYELCSYIAPLFCNTQEEQIQFAQIFNHHFKPPVVNNKKTVISANKPKLLLHFNKYRKWYYLLATALLLAAVCVYYFTLKYFPAKKPQLFITTTASPGNPAKIKAALLFDDVTAAAKKNITAAVLYYSWGDNTTDSLPHHIYTADGVYNITVSAALYYKKRLWDSTVTASTLITVCRQNKTIGIKNAAEKDTFNIGETISLNAINTGRNKPDSINWQVTEADGASAFYSGFSLKHVCASQGSCTVVCIPFYNATSSFCNTDTAFFYIKDTTHLPVLSFSASANAKKLQPKYKVKDAFIIFAVLFLIASYLLYRFFSSFKKKAVRQQQEKIKVTEETYEQLIKSFSSNNGSRQLPLPAQNYLPLPEPEINDIARQMRRRISDEAYYLSTEKTIDKAIKNSGFFNPVFSQRTRQSEYLVLIDETFTNSQQVKLFEYLLELLTRRNVFIEKYYYRQTPALCYNKQAPAGISLEKLSQKYPGYVLLIMGNAYQLVYQLYPVIDASYIPLLNRWHYKAILTPVSFLDWGTKERKALSSALPVLPVDIPGQLLLMQKLFDENVNVIAGLNVYSKKFYEAATVEFEDADELYEYCENAEWAKNEGAYGNILYQWLAAVAVYPQLRWELVLAIGKAIMDSYGKTTEMNFTTLLRIARIKWMKEGRLPDYIRLSLLQRLHQQNEITARETILKVLNDIHADDINNTSFSYEELQVQRLTNEFVLYAFNPEKYAAYENSKAVYEQLYSHRQIADITGTTYLENAGNSWRTLINAPVADNTNALKGSVPLDEYFVTDDAQPAYKNKFYEWATKITSILAVAGFTILALLFALSRSSSSKPGFLKTVKPYKSSINFLVNNTTGNTANDKAMLYADTLQLPVTAGKPVAVPVFISDTPKNIKLTLNGRIIFDSLFVFNNDAYTMNIDEADNVSPSDFLAVRFIISNSCAGSIASSYERLVKKADSTLQISYETNDISTANNATRTNCINSIAYGSQVTIATARAIVKQFSSYGIILNDATPAFAVAPREIVIYNNEQQNTKDDIVPKVKPVVYVQVSDNGLISSAANFRSQLLKKDFDVKPVSVQTYNYNSEISYYSNDMAAAANIVKQQYNSFYPQMNVQARLRKAPVSGNSYSNVIAVWIKKLEPVIAIKPVDLAITDVKLPATAANDKLLTVSFTIVNKTPSAASASQITPTGQICVLSEPTCGNFSFSLNKVSQTITQQINISNKAAGRHQVVLTVKDYKINQVLGYVTVTEPPVAENKTLLWLDDQPSNNVKIITQLQKEGWKIQAVTTADEALTYLKKTKFTNVITDLQGANTDNNTLGFLKSIDRLVNKSNVIIYTSPASEKLYGKQAMSMGYTNIVTMASDLLKQLTYSPYEQSKK